MLIENIKFQNPGRPSSLCPSHRHPGIWPV